MTQITIDRALVEQALEALDEADTFHRNLPDQRARRLTAITALRAALAQQDPEFLVTNCTLWGSPPKPHEYWSEFFSAMVETRTLAGVFISDAALAQQDEPTPPPEAVSEAEKTAYAAGWWAALAQQAEINVPVPNGLAQSDAEFWLRHRADIIEACRAHGLTIVTTAHGVHLMQLGKIEAQQADPAPGWCKHCKQYSIEEPLPAQQAEPTQTPCDIAEDGVCEVIDCCRNPAQPAEPVDQAVMELAESVGLIGPASRTHDLHGAIQRFHDLIVMNASIKAAAAFAAPPQRKPLTEKELEKIMTSLKSPSGFKGWWWQDVARAIERAHGIGGDDGQA